MSNFTIDPDNLQMNEMQTKAYEFTHDSNPFKMLNPYYHNIEVGTLDQFTINVWFNWLVVLGVMTILTFIGKFYKKQKYNSEAEQLKRIDSSKVKKLGE